MRTSSGLGDALAAGPRRALFEDWFRDKATTRCVQDAFHRHRWPNAPEMSVRMSRPEACTVSITTLEVGPTRITMAYEEQFGIRDAELGTKNERGLRNAEVVRNEPDSTLLPHSALGFPC
jgi:hypothetical protein